MNKEPFSSPFWTPPLLSERSSGREERCRDRERWRIDGASMTAAAAAFRSPYVRILPFPFSVPPPSLFVLCKEKRRGGGRKTFPLWEKGAAAGQKKVPFDCAAQESVIALADILPCYWTKKS